MKKVMLAVMAVVMMSGCTPKTVEFMDSMQVEGQHEKAMKFLGNDKGTLVYKASDEAKKCIRDRIEARGYYMLQDDLDCYDNVIK